jgi:nucleotide-binding universal stress UspA family protein
MRRTAAWEKPVRAQPGKSTRSGAPTRSRVRRPSIGPLLIVGEEGSPLGGALRVAEAVARRHGVPAHVLGVSRPHPSLSPNLLSRAVDLERREPEARRREAEHARLRGRVQEAVGLSSHFSTAVETGEFLRTAADAARVRKVEYVLVGLPEPGAPARAGAEDAALRLSERLDLPVLAVPADADLLPRTALVSMDLGEASMRAARATVPLLADGGSLTLAYVQPAAKLAPPDAPGRAGPGSRVLDRVLYRLRGTLRLARNLEVRTLVLQGGPAEALLEAARDMDLIAVGSPMRRSSSRSRSGSVFAGVLRGAGIPVLIAPAPRQGGRALS